MIERFTTNGATEWARDVGVTTELCHWPELASGGLGASLMVRFPEGSLGKRVGKVLATAVSLEGAEEIVFSLVSFRRASGAIGRAQDASYALDVVDGLGVTRRYYVPAFKSVAQVEIPAAGIPSVAAFYLYCLHGVADQVCLSNMLAVSDDTPIDLMRAVKAAIGVQRDRLYGYGREIGTATFAFGALKVTIATNWDWVEKYAVLRFVGAGVDEVHQLENVVGNEATFARTYGGQKMLSAGTAVKVYVTFPVEIGRYDVETRMPGVCIWYNGPDPEPATSRQSREVKVIGPSGPCLKRDGLLVKWNVTMDTDARSPELIANITEAIRNFIASGTVWVHGKKYWFEWTEPAAPVEPDAAYDIVPKSAYTISVAVREDSWDRIVEHGAGPADLGVLPVEPDAALEYMVEYDGNGATAGVVPLDMETYAEGDVVTVLGNTGGLERPGFTFDGWTME